MEYKLINNSVDEILSPEEKEKMFSLLDDATEFKIESFKNLKARDYFELLLLCEIMKKRDTVKLAQVRKEDKLAKAKSVASKGLLAKRYVQAIMQHKSSPVIQEAHEDIYEMVKKFYMLLNGASNKAEEQKTEIIKAIDAIDENCSMEDE